VAVAVAVDGGGSGEKMEGIGQVLREIRMVDWQWQWQGGSVAVGWQCVDENC
jgi:hypothetical protein